MSSGLTEWMQSPLVPWLAAAAVRGAWESLALAGLLTGLSRALPGLTFRTDAGMWSVGFFAACVLPFCCTSFSGHLGPRHLGSGHLGSGHLGPGHTLAITAHASGTLVAPLFTLSPEWAAAVCAAWFLASLAMLARFGAGLWSLSRLLRGAAPASSDVEATYRSVAAGGRAGKARLLVSAAVASPSACGFGGPTVVLPLGLAESLSREELEGVLRHEAAHLNRRDDLLTLLAQLARAAAPFAVGLPYLQRQLARTREMACDDAALGAGISRRVYAACLTRLAEGAGARHWNRLAPGLGGEQSQLAVRIGRILRGSSLHPAPGLLRLAAAGGASVLVCMSMLLSPALLSFDGHSAPEPAHRGSMSNAAASVSPPAQHLRLASWRPPAAFRKPKARHKATGDVRRIATPQFTAQAPSLVFCLERQAAPDTKLIFFLLPSRDTAAPSWQSVFLLTI